jgi:predicted outer membrane protein
MKQKIRFVCVYFFVPLLVIYACTTKTDNDSKRAAEKKNNEKFVNRENERDAKFVVDNVSNMYDEIRLSTLAEEHTANAQVRNVAKDVRMRYSELLKELKKYASSKAISVPAGESEKEKNKIEKLVNDKSFDKDWSAELRDLNKQTIDNFEKGSTELADDDLKGWVTASLPAIRKSHDKIVACNNQLN